jgi:hypothetical protein
LEVVAYQTEQYEDILKLMKTFLQPLVHHSPPLFSRFIFNLHDHPVIPYTLHSTYPMFSVCKMDYYTDHQPPPPPPQSLLLTTEAKNDETRAVLVAGHNTLVQAYAADLFSKQPKEPQPGTKIDQNGLQSKDLVVPYHFTLQIENNQKPGAKILSHGEDPHRVRGKLELDSSSSSNLAVMAFIHYGQTTTPTTIVLL